MKKNLMLLMMAFTFSMGAIASNSVKKETSNIQTKQTNKALVANQAKPFIDLCIMIEVWVTDCPDGSIGILAVDAYVVDCRSGAPIAGATILSNTGDEACGN
jgi:hypothetical protein